MLRYSTIEGTVFFACLSMSVTCVIHFPSRDKIDFCVTDRRSTLFAGFKFWQTKLISVIPKQQHAYVFIIEIGVCNEKIGIALLDKLLSKNVLGSILKLIQTDVNIMKLHELPQFTYYVYKILKIKTFKILKFKVLTKNEITREMNFFH